MFTPLAPKLSVAFSYNGNLRTGVIEAVSPKVLTLKTETGFRAFSWDKIVDLSIRS